MRNSNRSIEQLLRIYPREWRDRYGGELKVTIEDCLEGSPPSLNFLIPLALCGAKQRYTYFVSAFSPGSGPLSGTMLGIIAWALALIGCSSFVKLTEHWRNVPRLSKLPIELITSDVFRVSGLVSFLCILVGAALSAPYYFKMQKGPSKTKVNRRIVWFLLLASAFMFSTVSLVLFAHHMNSIARNGGNPLFAGVFLAWGILYAVTVIAGCLSCLEGVRQIKFSAQTINLQVKIGLLGAILVSAISLSALLMLFLMVVKAPGFLSGGPAGHPGSPWTLITVLTAGALLMAFGLSLMSVIKTSRYTLAKRTS
ncbi:MAG: hypothetical protein HKL80_11170 [Acidimicrobiales bacterium]|nr:hypothetical protein [Acidimicrobiales bacterium]